MKTSLLLTLLAVLTLGEFTPARADNPQLKNWLALMRQMQPPPPRPPRYRAPVEEAAPETAKPTPPEKREPRSKTKR